MFINKTTFSFSFFFLPQNTLKTSFFLTHTHKVRIVRPGSVVGPQQHFLEQMQIKMWKSGDEYRKKHDIKLEHDPRIEKIV